MSKFTDTIHKLSTKFGFKTPHKYPSTPQEERGFIDLTDQLYPTGRAWRFVNSSSLEKLHKAINDIFISFRDDAYSIVNTVIPDNEFFTVEDCIYWEGKLGLVSNSQLTLQLRKEIILTKLSFPKNIKARQSLNYMQKQLISYGFTEVKIYANMFQNPDGSYYYLSPQDIATNASMVVQHGGTTQHGNSTQHGDSNFEVIANEITNEDYSTGGDAYLWATFFIASPISLYEKGAVPNIRKQEFKELILKLKPAHTVAFTLINYI